MSNLQIMGEQWVHLPILLSPEAAAGRTYIVTGANVGLGLETAKHFVRLGASSVILAVRNVEAGQKAKSEIEHATGRTGIAQVWQLDLSSYASVRAFADRAAWELERIDAVLENAAVAADRWALVEGLETCIKVNVASTMFLGALLLPKLIESGKKHGFSPRLVFVVSSLGFSARGELQKFTDDEVFLGLNDPKRANMDGVTRYAVSKLIEIYAVRQFATAFPVEQTGVVINMVNPGLCKTSLARDNRTRTKLLLSVMRKIAARTAEEGSRTLLHAVVAEEHGKFLSACEVKEDWIQPWMTDDSGRRMQSKIWTELMAILERVQPGCLSLKTGGAI